MQKGFWFWSAAALLAGGLALTVTFADDPFRTAPAEGKRPAAAADKPVRRLPDEIVPDDISPDEEPLPASESEEETPRPYVRTKAIAPNTLRKKFSGLFDEPAAEESAEQPKSLPPAKPGTLHKIEPSEVPAEVDIEPELDAPSAARLRTIQPADYKAQAGKREPVTPISESAASKPTGRKSAESVAPKPAASPSTNSAVTPRTAAAPKPTAAKEQVAPVANAEPPCVTVKWLPQGELSVGQESAYQLIVKNEGQGPAHEVEVAAHFPKSVRLLKADPAPTHDVEHLAWSIPTLAAGEERTIIIRLMPLARGDLATNASVRYSTACSLKAQVAEPQLVVALKGVSQATVGEACTHIVTVCNSGTGTAREVIVEAHIPAGLEAAQGKGKPVRMPIGSLSAGESREVRLQLTAVGSGEQVLTVAARAAGGLEHETQAKIVITAPKLEVAVTGPSLRFANRHARYQLTAANKGAAATNNVRLLHHVPAGFEFVKADAGGTYDPASRTVSWYVGHLEAGKTASASLELKARELGSHTHRVQITGDSVSGAEAKLETKVDGTQNLVMEVADLDDPVEVHSQTACEICVRNDGSKAATNLSIVCDLPAGVEFLGAEGPAKHSLNKGQVVFAPVAELAPQKSLKFRVLLQGKSAGQMRFRAQLTSAATTEPIVVEERTRFYQD